MWSPPSIISGHSLHRPTVARLFSKKYPMLGYLFSSIDLLQRRRLILLDGYSEIRISHSTKGMACQIDGINQYSVGPCTNSRPNKTRMSFGRGSYAFIINLASEMFLQHGSWIDDLFCGWRESPCLASFSWFQVSKLEIMDMLVLMEISWQGIYRLFYYLLWFQFFQER